MTEAGIADMKVAGKRGDLRTKAYRTESEGREANIMKRVGLWAVGIGVLASVGLLTVTQGYAGDNDGATKCTVKTLKGRYLFRQKTRVSGVPTVWMAIS